MDGFEKRKEQKKEIIRRAALELFQSLGFQKVSINDIATRAGVSPVTIYNHFGSKEDLTRDVLKWYCMVLLERYRGIMESDRPFAEKLEEIIFDKSKVVNQFQGELLEKFSLNDVDMQAFLQDLYINHQLPLVKKFLDEAVRHGNIDRKYSLEAIMIYFEIIRRGFFSMPEISEQSAKNPELMKEIIEICTYGLNG